MRSWTWPEIRKHTHRNTHKQEHTHAHTQEHTHTEWLCTQQGQNTDDSECLRWHDWSNHRLGIMASSPASSGSESCTHYLLTSSNQHLTGINTHLPPACISFSPGQLRLSATYKETSSEPEDLMWCEVHGEHSELTNWLQELQSPLSINAQRQKDEVTADKQWRAHLVNN